MKYKVEKTKSNRHLVYKRRPGGGLIGFLFPSWQLMHACYTEEQVRATINEDIKDDTIMSTRYFDSRGREDLSW